MRQVNKIFYRKIQLPFKVKNPILAVGSNTKNTLMFAKGNTALISPINHDLSNPQDFFSFKKSFKVFVKKRPKIIAFDLHPDYISTKYVQDWSLRHHVTMSPVQHHHAHIAACMAENGLKNTKVIGVAFDGTGLGTNAGLWGGEFFICDYKKFKRSAHLKEVPLLGAENAILEPWRVTLAWLYNIYSEKFQNLNLTFLKRIKKDQLKVFMKMYQIGFNSPSSSSMGRLFDAVAALIIDKKRISFEAELAIALEKKAGQYRLKAKAYDFKIKKTKDGYIIDPSKTFSGVIADINKGEKDEKIAYRFHLTIAKMIEKTAIKLKTETKIKKVVLSGGVFQNRLLSKLSVELLTGKGFKVYYHKTLLANDSALSLGQVAVANYKG